MQVKELVSELRALVDKLDGAAVEEAV